MSINNVDYLLQSNQVSSAAEKNGSLEKLQEYSDDSIFTNYLSAANEESSEVSETESQDEAIETFKKLLEWISEITKFLKPAEGSEESSSGTTTEKSGETKGTAKTGETGETEKSGETEETEKSGETGESEETISDEAAKIYADQLFDAMNGFGTDEAQVESILNNENLTSADIAKITAQYNESHGSLVNAIDGDFSGSEKTELLNKVADSLLEGAENGDETSLQLLCKEFHAGTAGKLGTADEFIARIFENADSDTLNQIIMNYSSVNEGADIFKDVKGDFSGSTQKEYLQKLNDALAQKS